MDPRQRSIDAGVNVAEMGRRVGIAGLLFSVGVACTQLFGGEQNTLAPVEAAKPPTIAMPALQPVAGRTEVCAAGQMRCDGALLQACADDRSGWVTAQHCAAAALCQEAPAACLAATCSADEMTCSGAVLQKCNADRTGWDLFATCLSPAHCNADLRQCMTEPCNAGDRRCDRSELDQSPVLEVCRDDRTDWGPLDACVTRELCDQTLSGGAPGGGLVLGSDGMVQIQAPAGPGAVLTCNLPACAVGEVRCEGSQLEFCSEGRTGWTVAEECASPALCAGSLTNLGPGGEPVCLAPACAPNQHQCAEGGVLQVCSEDRTGFRVIQTCIGPPFCNAVLADQGQEGCRDAPCVAGEMQCNGAQIQVCRQDRTALDDTGALCESPALCNADDPTNAFCEDPACRRGATSGSEFRCEGAQLERCNEALSGYDTVQTCATPALCDASQRLTGCRPPACQPGQHACNADGFLQTCNADQTGFENTENCGSPGQCDANAGRCSDPCEPGTVRCNEQSGDLEECRDLLTGWQTIADCVSLPLCDAANRRCRPPLQECPAGTPRRFCDRDAATGNAQIKQCSPGRDRLDVITCRAGQICDAQNNQCDICTPNSVTCDGDTLVRCDPTGQAQNRQQPACGPGLCSADKGRCLVCNPLNSARCSGLQLRVCTQGDGGNEFERSENCDTAELCAQTLNGCGSGLNGQSCQCNDGVCAPGQLRCQNGRIERCNAGLTAFETLQTCANGCNPGSTVCNECSTGQCTNNQFIACNNGRRAPAITCDDSKPCTANNCTQNGCQFPADNNARCADANLCNGTETCQGGECRAGTLNSCSDTNPCNIDSPNNCNPQNGSCAHPPGPDSTVCQNNQLQRCVNGQQTTDNCNGLGCNPATNSCNQCQNNATRCASNNTATQRCVNGQFQAATTPCPAPADACKISTCNPQSGTCGNANAPRGTQCAGGTCDGAGNCQICTPGAPGACVNNGFPMVCNANGTGFILQENLCEGNNRIRCNGTARLSEPCGVAERCVDLGTFASCACTDGTTRCSNGQPQQCINGAFSALGFCVNAVANVCNGDNVVPTPCPGAGNPCGGATCNGTGSACTNVDRSGAACNAPGLGAGTCEANGACCTPLEQCRTNCATSADCGGLPCTNGVCVF
jgi:hypothetical protein